MSKLWVFIGIIFLTGCFTTRTYTIEKPRVDRDMQGNQGFLSGTPKAVDKQSRLSDTRKISVVEVEFGSREEELMEREADYKIKKKALKEEISKGDFVEAEIIDDEDDFEAAEEVIERQAPQEQALDRVPETYVVQKDDTLQKVSHKFYNTTRKWQMLYETNKDVIKDPDRLYPGTKIRIP